MTCQECVDLLSALIDRELSADELKHVWTHLRECVSCCLECAQLCCLDAATGQACCSEASDKLWERVQRAVAVCCALPSPSSVSGEGRGGGAEVLTPEEAASYLRLRVDELLASLDALPHFKVGEHVRFRRRGLEQWMEAQEQRATQPQPATVARPGLSRAEGNVVDFAEAQARMSRVGRM
jgi:excisionase family DNA binding protein